MLILRPIQGVAVSAAPRLKNARWPDLAIMKQPIVAYRLDEEGQWVAELACGHSQHIRHDPPWQVRPWVLTEEGRRKFLGAVLDCPYCDREL